MRNRLTKKADPYTLGRDKANPPVEKYMTGDPSKWSEDPDMTHRWEDDTREETGHPGPNKKEKEAPEWPKSAKEAALKSAKELKAKAINCVRIAGYMFPKASEAELENVGFSLMELSDRSIQATLEMIDKHDKTASSDEVGAELRELVARTKKLVAEAEAEEEKADEAKEEDEDEKEAEEAKEEDEDEKEMSEQEKSAAVIAKKAKVLIAEAELSSAEGKEEEAEEKKKEAKKLLAKAKKVLAGELPPALQENAQKMKEEAKEEEVPAVAAPIAPVAEEKKEASEDAELSDSKIPEELKDKKEAALRHLEAAKKLMAEVEAEEKGDAALSQEHPAAAEEDEKEEAEEAKEGDDNGTSAEAEKLNAGEGMEQEDADGDFDGDIDMVPSESDEELDDLFMSPDMKEAQEAYEGAFGKDEQKEASSKTASKKKGAKTLGAGVKISSANSADDLSNLWDCPPDVSHVFKN